MGKEEKEQLRKIDTPLQQATCRNQESEPELHSPQRRVGQWGLLLCSDTSQ